VTDELEQAGQDDSGWLDRALAVLQVAPEFAAAELAQVLLACASDYGLTRAEARRIHDVAGEMDDDIGGRLASSGLTAAQAIRRVLDTVLAYDRS
jgi:hypothetical protein